MMKKMRKGFGILASLALAVTLIAVPANAEEEGNAEFDELMDEYFAEVMESDYMTLHYTLRDYSAYDIEKPELTIGTADYDSYGEDLEMIDEMIEKVKSFDYDSLSVSQQHDYDTLLFSLERTNEINENPMLDFYFTPTEGVINNLLTNFTEFVFYEKEDFDDYLEVLSSVPAYLDEALELTKKQAAEGCFMTDEALTQTREDIAKFVAKTDDNQLIVIFDNAVDEFDGLTDEEKTAYKEKNKDIVLNEYIPAYKKVSEELEALRGTRTGSGSFAELPGGKEYYAGLAKRKTSLDLDVEDMLELCTAYLEDKIDEYIGLYDDNDYSFEDETLDMEDPEEVLKFLQNALTKDYPEGPKVTYTATYLDESVANDGVIAYYMQPPVDDIKDNVIKINPNGISDSIDMYMTMAHEGFPGHLFQITWYLNTNPSKVRSVLGNSGYTEGWGMISEMEALAYTDLSEKAQKNYGLVTGISYVMDAAVDLGVNGLGWEKSDVAQYLDGLGLNSSIAGDLYEFVTSDPGTILPYGVGLAKYTQMKEDAMKTLGDDFDLKEYNEVLLTYGDRPFAVVEQDIENWISEKKGTASMEKTAEPETTAEAAAEPAATAEPAAAAEVGKDDHFFFGGVGAGVVLAVILAIVAANKNRKASS